MAEKKGRRWISRRWIFLLYIIVLGIPFINPIGIPLVVHDNTKALYNKVEALKPGDVVLWAWSIGLSGWSELGSAQVAFTAHVLSKPGVKLVMVGDGEGVLLYERLIDEIRAKISSNVFGKVYGADYINLLVVGGETGQAAFMTDIRGTIQYDFYGKKLDSYPIMTVVNKGKDFAFAVTAKTVDIAMDIRTIVILGECPLAAIMMAGQYPFTISYYKAGSIFAALFGVGGGAEYELLTGFKGAGVTYMDAMSSGPLVVIILVAIANIELLLGEFGKKSGVEKHG